MTETAESSDKLFLTERSLLGLCIVLGALQSWFSRYAMISDGVSYLDIGDAYLRGDWAAAVNAYWSPMYSWWLGLSLYVVRPSIGWEFIVVHLVNLVIYVLALFSFRFFIHSVLRALRGDRATGSDDFLPLPEEAFLSLGYGLFLWGSLVLIDVGLVAPDLLVAAIVFLIAGCLVDLRVQHSYWKFAAFGVLNGVAYLSKGIMFPLGFGFLAILLFSGKLSRRRVYGVLLSAALFLIVCSPFILALSKAKGRLTFGDTGRLAYAAQVSPSSPNVHWQGEPPGSGTPRHPTRKLLEDPAVFEFGDPVRGTYPRRSRYRSLLAGAGLASVCWRVAGARMGRHLRGGAHPPRRKMGARREIPGSRGCSHDASSGCRAYRRHCLRYADSRGGPAGERPGYGRSGIANQGLASG